MKNAKNIFIFFIYFCFQITLDFIFLLGLKSIGEEKKLFHQFIVIFLMILTPSEIQY